MSWWVAGAAAVGTIGSSVIGANAAKDAGKEAAQASQAAINSQLAMYQQGRLDTAPYRQVGGYALDAYARAMGLSAYNPNDQRYNQTDPTLQTQLDAAGSGVNAGAFAPTDPSKLVKTGQLSDGGREILVDPATGYGYVMAVHGGNAGAPVPIGAKVPGYEPKPQAAQPGAAPAQSGPAGDPNDRYGGFYASPGYKFTLDEALQGVERSAGASGYLPSGPGSLSGRFSKAMSRYSAGLASGEFNNYMARLGDLSGVGSNAANASSNAALQTGANVGNAQIAGGNAQANATMNRASSIAGGFQGLANIGGYLGGSLYQPRTPSYIDPYNPTVR
jgi:hypothetical protein